MQPPSTYNLRVVDRANTHAFINGNAVPMMLVLPCCSLGDNILIFKVDGGMDFSGIFGLESTEATKPRYILDTSDQQIS